MILPWLLDYNYLPKYRRYIDFTGKHTLISGLTGSGKTVSSALLLSRIARYQPNSILYLLDFKADDFSDLMGCTRYYPYAACATGMEMFNAAFQARLNGTDTSRTPLICCIDEWGAFVSSQDKKQADIYKRLLGTFLMLGRSLGVIIICGLQRPDSASYFTNSGIRDQFGTVCTLGTQSSQSTEMLYSYYKDLIKPTTRIGEGYMISGGDFYHVQVPQIQRFDLLVEEIRPIVD